ncbi:hypothetical protein Tco_0060719 [Tanacetum coccineum]
MRTRSQTRNRNRQQQAQPAVVQPFHLEEPFVNPPLVPMADNRTMAQLLQAPTEGYEDAIVIPEINANFELKHGPRAIPNLFRGGKVTSGLSSLRLASSSNGGDEVGTDMARGSVQEINTGEGGDSVVMDDEIGVSGGEVSGGSGEDHGRAVML